MLRWRRRKCCCAIISSAQSQVKFATGSGELMVARKGERLPMDFPIRRGQRIEVSDEIVAALGARPSETYRARDLLAVFSAESQVASLKPNQELVAELDAFAVIVSAKGDEVDFVSCFFGPRAGIREGPVTGSAHCALISYWASRLGQDYARRAAAFPARS
jgi:predicted PhzF superfamily epimerase YddE/YHI9